MSLLLALYSAEASLGYDRPGLDLCHTQSMDPALLSSSLSQLDFYFSTAHTIPPVLSYCAGYPCARYPPPSSPSTRTSGKEDLPESSLLTRTFPPLNTSTASASQ